MRRLLNSFEAVVSISLMLLMCASIILQVIFRYFLEASLDWPEELGRYLFIAAVFIGVSYVEQHDRHLAITALQTNGPRIFRRFLPLFAPLVTAAFSALMVVWGIKMTIFVYETNQVMPAMLLPMWIVYAFVPLGMFCMGCRALQNFFRVLKKQHGNHGE
ncbi:MAG: TRAP transporter small permease [Desulfovibrio sp.]|nr:TRAP transporter small permease [Desulfovibrio sp.]